MANELCGEIDILFLSDDEVDQVNILLKKQEDIDIGILASSVLTPAPQEPTNLQLVSISGTTADLDWDAPEGDAVDSYTVYVKNTDSNTLEQTITGIVLSEVQVMGLSSDTNYEFWVTAIRDSIESKESNSITGLTEVTCDLSISSVDVSEGTTTVNASSSNPPIEYSIEPSSKYHLDFDGIDDNINCGDFFLSDNFTIECRFKTDGSITSESALVSKWSTNEVYEWLLTFNGSGQILFAKAAPNQQFPIDLVYHTNETFDDGEWHQIHAVCENETIKIYIDGVQKSLTQQADNGYGGLNNTSVDIVIGDRVGYDAPFNGQIDEIALWSKGLSQSEVYSSINNVYSGDEEGLEAYYRAEEGSGTTLTDSTDNNRQGSINGATYVEKPAIFDWTTDNTFEINDKGKYLAKCRDANSCTDEMEFEKTFTNISLVGASGIDIQASSTTSTVTIPSSVKEGDFLTLHVMHRDTLSLPSGWTLLETTSPSSIVANQMESVAYKIAESSDAGTTVTTSQGSSGRIITHVTAFKGIKELTVHKSQTDQQSSIGLTVPELSVDADNQMALVSMTNVYAQTSGTTNLEYNDSTYNQTTPISIEQNRLGVAHKLLNSGDIISGKFVNQAEDTDRTAVSILLRELYPTVYETNFDEYSVGGLPSDWEVLFGSLNSGYSIVDIGSGNNVIESDGTSGLHSVAPTKLRDLQDSQIVTKMRIDSVFDPRLTTYFRFQDADNWYLAELTTSDRFQIWKSVGGSTSNVSSHSFNYNADTFYWIKILIEGNRFRAKVWEDGNTEPSSWLVDVNDTSISDAGRTGIGFRNEIGQCDYFKAEEV